MSGFHPFPRLPLELRQQIWEASIQPREVAVGVYLSRRRRTGPPAILQVNREARLHLQRFYTRCCHFETKRLFQAPVKRYSYINFPIDTLYCNLSQLSHFKAHEISQIQHLVLECNETEGLLSTYGRYLRSAGALQTVRVLYFELVPDRHVWWRGWVDLMHVWYHRCVPVPFWTTIVAPKRDDGVEVTPDNWMELDREWRSGNEYYEGISDEEDDVDAPWRFWLYGHEDGCSCTSKRKWHVQTGHADAGKAAWQLL